ncbi:energy transducer TonB [candidate division KSB1 bacterium]|nr:energy transducer TonB [candidate division KSB1 bacterium]
MLLYKPLASITLFPFNDKIEGQIPEPLTFDLVNPLAELVETPPDAEIPEPQNARYMSDKNARAQDIYADNDLPSGDAFSRGRTDYKLFAGGGNLTEQVPQQVSEQTAEQTNDQHDLTDSPEQEESLTSGDVRLFDNQRYTRRSQKFDPALLRGSGANRTLPANNFSDDVNWDNQNSDARDLGGVSLNTYAWDFAPYIIYMKRRMREHIYPPPAFSQMGAIQGEILIRFRVERDGTVSKLELISYKGHKSLAETSLNAVKGSDPFKQLPENFPEKYLELTWTFIYSIFR